MLLEQRESGKLSPEEMDRLDKLLSAARAFHYSAFVLSGISLALSSLDAPQGIELPIGGVTIPAVQATVGVYVLVLVSILASDRLFEMARPWLKRDRRRPPFAWIALGTGQTAGGSILLWLLLPVVICAFSTATTLATEDINGILLSFAGVALLVLPRTTGEYWSLIRKRRDHRGGPATFSIWLLYWYRLERAVTSFIFLFLPVVAVVPKWRENTLDIMLPLLVLIGVLSILRTIAGFPLIYRRIDRFGRRLGFPAETMHYD